MLLLVMTKDLQHFCGASILTQRHAITAAHCTYPLKPNTSISVVAGAHDKRKINQRSVVVPVQKYLIHESYSPTLVMDDISLLFLQKPLRFGPNVSPICIPTKKMCLENKDVLMIGWGMTGGDKPASNVLRRIDVKILPYHVCKYNYFFMYNPFPWKVSQICTRAKGKGGCRGDSGGPVIYLDPEVRSYVLAGLVSFGEATCSTDYPTVETDVSYYVSWITSRIKEGYCHKV
ncbi:chymotrypsin-1 isoform X2 [Halyomorpha halys]|nr:chymotrypsin-1 isoform X2 [Halyomorpha halys]